MIRNVRVSLDTIGLAELGLVNAVNLGDLNVLLLERGSGLLVVRGESLAVTTPTPTQHGKRLCYDHVTYQGAKNSTRMRDSGFTTASKLSCVRSRTSEPSTAEKRAKAAAEVNRRENRIVREGVVKERRGLGGGRDR